MLWLLESTFAVAVLLNKHRCNVLPFEQINFYGVSNGAFAGKRLGSTRTTYAFVL